MNRIGPLLTVNIVSTYSLTACSEIFCNSDPIYEEEMPPVQQHTTTYEELRKKNREEYQQRRTAAYRFHSLLPYYHILIL